MTPALPYDPVRPATKSTMPSVIVEMGSRAKKPANSNDRAPRVARSLRYGDSICPSLGVGCDNLRAVRRRARDRRAGKIDTVPTPDARPYDALLLLSFGGPEKPDDVLPFLENVTAGRGIPRE